MLTFNFMRWDAPFTFFTHSTLSTPTSDYMHLERTLLLFIVFIMIMVIIYLLSSCS